MSTAGVTFVIPVLNGGATLRDTLDAIEAQADGRPFEIITVDDGSHDGSLALLRQREGDGRLILLEAAGRGAAAAINAGIARARHPIVCQVDQDVVVGPGWMQSLVDEFEDPRVAAAQGHYVNAPEAGIWARAMGRDLEQRYATIRGRFTDHVCTGNTAYRRSALLDCGLLNESLGYGYDNDLSYRLCGLGYRLAFTRTARSIHHWREGPGGYLRQQFGFGYGRLDLLRLHPRRVRGDDVAGTVMMMHAPAMLLALVLVAVSMAAPAGASLSRIAVAIAASLALERTVAGVLAWRRSGDRAALLFAPVHLLRDVAWAWAIVVWLWRRMTGRAGQPGHSMRRRHSGPARESCMPAPD